MIQNFIFLFPLHSQHPTRAWYTAGTHYFFIQESIEHQLYSGYWLHILGDTTDNSWIWGWLSWGKREEGTRIPQDRIRAAF